MIHDVKKLMADNEQGGFTTNRCWLLVISGSFKVDAH